MKEPPPNPHSSLLSEINSRNFIRAKSPAPVLNTPNFQKTFGGLTGYDLPLDDQNLLRMAEMIALPGTKFQLLQPFDNYISRVKTDEYPGDNLFVDLRFFEAADFDTPQREKKMAPTDVLQERLKNLLGTSYVWGGNWSQGIPEMLAFYPPKKPLDEKSRTIWTFQGIDCSGLLYEVTEGYSARSTAELVNFGKSLPIQNRRLEAIIDLLIPMDLIVWKGHVLIVLDRKTLIESRSGFGVILRDTKERLEEIMQERVPVDDWDSTSSILNRFVVNRWHT